MTDAIPHGTAEPPQLRGAKRCGAKNRRGLPCARAALHGKTRCRLHGGLSTGPRTPEGLARRMEANLRHGRRSKLFQEIIARAGMALTALESEAVAASMRVWARASAGSDAAAHQTSPPSAPATDTAGSPD